MPMHLDPTQHPHTPPHALADPHRQLPPLEPLINKPHPNHEALLLQIALPPPVHKLPHLSQHVLWQPASSPDIPHNDTAYGVARGVARREKQVLVGRPEALVTFALGFGDGVAPALAVAFVVLVGVFSYDVGAAFLVQDFFLLVCLGWS